MSAASILLFLITSRIEETIDNIVFRLPIVDSILFAGSPHAARSILSTIATGWATILSVAFSVTLIALQLAATRNTSELVNEFENDRMNQITLGWFIATVVYSLLVLKTVRTGENGVEAFTPIIGVNVSVLFAIVAMFFFIAYLHNISSYIKSHTLIDRITRRTIKSLSKIEENEIDLREALFSDDSLPDHDSVTKVLAPQRGFLVSIDWKKMASRMPTNIAHGSIKVQWQVAVGDRMEREDLVATVYHVDKEGVGQDPTNSEKEQELDRDAINDWIISCLMIGQKRSLSNDPLFGLEVLRNIAMKARNQSDINSIESCVNGIYRILVHVLKRGDVIGMPFYLENKADKKGGNSAILMLPKEENLTGLILSELSNIYDACRSNRDLDAVLTQFAKEYSAWGTNLLDQGKIEAFHSLTEWYANLLAKTHPRLKLRSDKVADMAQADGESRIAQTLSQFRKSVEKRHSFASHAFDINMKRFVTDSHA